MVIDKFQSNLDSHVKPYDSMKAMCLQERDFKEANTND